MKAAGWVQLMVCCQLLTLFPLGGPPAHAFRHVRPSRDIGSIEAGRCLSSSLSEKQLSSQVISQIIDGLEKGIDFRRMEPGTAYFYRLDRHGRLIEFTIEDRGDLLHLSHFGQQPVLKRIKGERRTALETVRVWYEKGTGDLVFLHEAASLSGRIEEVLGQETELALELQRGNGFTILAEKIYRGPVLLQYGSIQAFQSASGRRAKTYLNYRGRFYDEQGRSLNKLFLAVPLHYDFVSCEFMKERRHPILGGVRPHRGVDFAAPLGTPVWAVADGQVTTARFLTGFGLTVILRHAHGYETLYGHLSRFAPEIHPGAKVGQKQVIGYIGSTGLSTGPHLHFGLTCKGLHRDPFKEDFPRASILSGDERVSFMERLKQIKPLLTGAPGPG